MIVKSRNGRIHPDYNAYVACPYGYHCDLTTQSFTTLRLVSETGGVTLTFRTRGAADHEHTIRLTFSFDNGVTLTKGATVR